LHCKIGVKKQNQSIHIARFLGGLWIDWSRIVAEMRQRKT
jgi:hypothetical protein